MLRWAFVFAAVALIAGALGFSGLAGEATDVAKLLFGPFLVVFVVMVALAVMTGQRLRR